MSDEPFYAPNRQAAPPRQPKPGEEVWRLTDQKERTQRCELRNDEHVGAGWDVMILENGEPLISRRCGNEAEARFVAEACRQDLLRTGWSAAQHQSGRTGEP